MKTEDRMNQYHFQTIHDHIQIIESAAKEIKKLSNGMQAIDVNVDAILVYTYLLGQNVSQVVELESEKGKGQC